MLVDDPEFQSQKPSNRENRHKPKYDPIYVVFMGVAVEVDGKLSSLIDRQPRLPRLPRLINTNAKKVACNPP